MGDMTLDDVYTVLTLLYGLLLLALPVVLWIMVRPTSGPSPRPHTTRTN